MRNVDSLGSPIGGGAVAPVTPGGRGVRFVGVLCVPSRVGIGHGVTRRSGIGRLGLLTHHGVGLFRARPEEQLAESADRGVLVLHQLGHVGVRLEDPANQSAVLLIERLLDAAQDVLQFLAVHFHQLQRVSHPAATGGPRRGFAGHLPGGRRGIPSGLQWSNGARSCKSLSSGQAGGPTGRQSAAAPVRVGSPAESRTAS